MEVVVYKAKLPVQDNETLDEYVDKLRDAAKAYLRKAGKVSDDKEVSVWPNAVWHNRGVFSVYQPGQERTKTVQMSLERDPDTQEFSFGDVLWVKPRTVYEPAGPGEPMPNTLPAVGYGRVTGVGTVFATKAKKACGTQKDEGQVVKAFVSAGLPSLQGLLAVLQAMREAYQVLHWNARGASSYGDHLLFDRLYSSVGGEVDGVAEKLTGMSSGANPIKVDAQASRMAAAAKPSLGTVQGMLAAEEAVCETLVPGVMNKLREAGGLSVGLDNFLQGLADAHEKNVYLLRQRLSTEVTKAILKTTDGLKPDDSSLAKPKKKAPAEAGSRQAKGYAALKSKLLSPSRKAPTKG